LDSNAPTSYAVAGIAGGTANIFAANVLDILDYSNTNKFKTARVINGVDVNGAGGYVEFTSSNWRSSSAVTSIQIITQNPTTLAASSSFALYGIK
jgi:predicted patatin/cPLA2 family phospholipase